MAAAPWHVPQLPKQAGQCRCGCPLLDYYYLLVYLHHGISFSRDDLVFLVTFAGAESARVQGCNSALR